MIERAPMTIQQQAEFMDYLVKRCHMSTGAVAAETYMLIEAAEVDDLKALAARLHRMAPHEQEIRRVVTGK